MYSFGELLEQYNRQREQCSLLDGRIAYCQNLHNGLLHSPQHSSALLCRAAQRRLAQLQKDCTTQAAALQLTHSRLRNALEALPRQVMRDVTEYRLLGGCGWDEIAILVGREPRHVRRLCSQSRKLLEQPSYLAGNSQTT